MEPRATLVPAIRFPPVRTVSPISFVGDSNVLAFRNLLFDIPEHFAQPVVTTAHFIPGLCAGTVFSGDALEARLADVVRAIVTQPLKRRDREAPGLANAVRRQIDSTLSPPSEDVWSFSEPTIVLVLGALDLLALVSEIGPATDFYFEDPAYNAAAFPEPVLPRVSFEMLRRLVERRVAPLASAFETLRAMGATHVYLHSLHPPTVDDAEYCRIRGAVGSAKVRYKTAIAINRIFGDIARAHDVAFLDLWDATTRDGTLDRAFEFDGDHLNRAAAVLTVEKLLTRMVVDRARPLDPAARPILDR